MRYLLTGICMLACIGSSMISCTNKDSNNKNSAAPAKPNILYILTDDAIAIKSGLNEEGLMIGIPSENIVIRHYLARNCQWGFAIGSEMSGGVRNIYIHDGYHDGTGRGSNFKSGAGRGNVVENIEMKNIRHGVVNFYNTSYGNGGNGPIPKYSNFNINNIRADGAGFGIKANVHPEKWFENFNFKNIHFKNVNEGVQIARTKGLTMQNISIESQKRAMILNDVSNALLKDLQLKGGGKTSLLVTGSQSGSIVIEGLDAAEIDCAHDLHDGALTANGTLLP